LTHSGTVAGPCFYPSEALGGIVAIIARLHRRPDVRCFEWRSRTRELHKAILCQRSNNTYDLRTLIPHPASCCPTSSRRISGHRRELEEIREPPFLPSQLTGRDVQGVVSGLTADKNRRSKVTCTSPKNSARLFERLDVYMGEMASYSCSESYGCYWPVGRPPGASKNIRRSTPT